MLTQVVYRQSVEQPADAQNQFQGASPLLTPTQIQQQQLASSVVDFLDRIDDARNTRNKTGLADDFCKRTGPLLAQMIDLNMRIDPNHLDGLVECGLKMLKHGLNTPATNQFAGLVFEARKIIVLPSVDSDIREGLAIAQAGAEEYAPSDESPAAKKFLLMFGTKPLSARSAA